MAKKLSVSSAREELVRMTSEDIRNRKWTEAEKQAVRRAAAKQAAGDDSGYRILGHSAADEGAACADGAAAWPRRKQAVSVRLDPQVLDWLRSKGEGHLTRINDILTNLMEAERSSKSAR